MNFELKLDAECLGTELDLSNERKSQEQRWVSVHKLSLQSPNRFSVTEQSPSHELQKKALRTRPRSRSPPRRSASASSRPARWSSRRRRTACSCPDHDRRARSRPSCRPPRSRRARRCAPAPTGRCGRPSWLFGEEKWGGEWVGEWVGEVGRRVGERSGWVNKFIRIVCLSEGGMTLESKVWTLQCKENHTYSRTALCRSWRAPHRRCRDSRGRQHQLWEEEERRLVIVRGHWRWSLAKVVTMTMITSDRMVTDWR